jgi:NitT/TauT family transport system substrate-binding protein
VFAQGWSLIKTKGSNMQRSRILLRLLAVALAFGLVAAACGDDDDDSSSADSGTEGTSAPSGELTKVKLQLQWFTQAQFAGYFAAVDQGYYEDLGLDVEIVEGGVDIVPATQLASGAVDFALSWVPKVLASREQGAEVTDISQVFQRSGTLQVSWADDAISDPADLSGKNVGNWGFGNEFELFAGMTEAGLDPASDVTLVQQQFDMQALLAREIDAAQAMTYNEYAQVLEAVNPDTGELYTPEDFAVINWNDVGTAMLQDAIWANTEKLSDPAYRDTAVKLVAGSLRGWIYCRDNAQECADIVVAQGSQLGESHQLWQMNEINKLIWPSPAGGIGTMDEKLWDQTVQVALGTKNAEGATVITAEPDADAWTGDINTEALALLEEKYPDLDVVGADFEPIEVELKEGGA